MGLAPTPTLDPLAITRPFPPSPSPLPTPHATSTLALALTATPRREQWLRVNKCSGSGAALGPGGAQCTAGAGCAANTTLCVHGQCYHAMWARSFPAADAVVEFFARTVRAWPLRPSQYPAAGGTCPDAI